MIKQENVAIVTLKKGEGRTIKAGGAWVFNNEIETITGRFHNGDLVIVHDFDGYPMLIRQGYNHPSIGMWEASNHPIRF